MDEGALPPRDEEAALAHPASQALAYLGVGAVTAIGVDALSQINPSFQHVHVAPGVSPLVALLAPLPHEALFALPLVILIAVLARETRALRVFVGLAVVLCGMLATNAWILPS